MEVSPALALLVDFIIMFVVAVFFVFAIQYWRIGKQLKGNKMIAEIWQSNGFDSPHLAEIESNGKTVKVGRVYIILRRKAKIRCIL